MCHHFSSARSLGAAWSLFKGLKELVTDYFDWTSMPVFAAQYQSLSTVCQVSRRASEASLSSSKAMFI